jgi:hypothetical protein
MKLIDYKPTCHSSFNIVLSCHYVGFCVLRFLLHSPDDIIDYSRSNAQFFYSASHSKHNENNLSRAERTKNTDPKKSKVDRNLVIKRGRFTHTCNIIVRSLGFAVLTHLTRYRVKNRMPWTVLTDRMTHTDIYNYQIKTESLAISSVKCSSTFFLICFLRSGHRGKAIR